MSRRLTLPTDSAIRKDVPLYSGCYTYFPAALAGVAKHSKVSNDKHNPGEPMHHARGKSSDHADCIARHLTDIADFLAHQVVWTQEEQDAIITEANALSWRALALSQELHEKFGAPLAPAARLPAPIAPEHVRPGVPVLTPESMAENDANPSRFLFGKRGDRGHTYTGPDGWSHCRKCGALHNLPTVDEYVPGYFDRD